MKALKDLIKDVEEEQYHINQLVKAAHVMVGKDAYIDVNCNGSCARISAKALSPDECQIISEAFTKIVEQRKLLLEPRKEKLRLLSELVAK